MNTKQSIFAVSFLCLVTGIGLISCSTDNDFEYNSENDSEYNSEDDSEYNLEDDPEYNLKDIEKNIYDWSYNKTAFYMLPLLNTAWSNYKGDIMKFIEDIINDQNPPEAPTNLQDKVRELGCVRSSWVPCSAVDHIYNSYKKDVSELLEETLNNEEFFSVKLEPRWTEFFKNMKEAL